MSFQEEQLHSQRREAQRAVRKFFICLLVVCLAGGYLVVGQALGFYHWWGGVISLLVLVLAVSEAIPIAARWHKLRLAPKCPVCGGLFSVQEETLRPASADGVDTLAAIVDRVSTCESCGRQHHHVFAATGEPGPIVPPALPDAAGVLLYDGRIRHLRLHARKSDAEIEQLVSELDSRSHKPSMTRPEWEKLLARSQQEARRKNQEQGMELPREGN